MGDPKTTRLSTAVASVSYTTKGQFLVSVKLAAFSRNNNWFLSGDNRFNWTSQKTYGLGTSTDFSAEVDTKFNFFRIYETLYRRVFPKFFAGAGFLFNSNTDVRPAPSAEAVWPDSPYVTYSEAKRIRSRGPDLGGDQPQRDLRQPRQLHRPEPGLVRERRLPLFL